MSQLAAEIARLPKLSLDELVDRYETLFGTEPPVRVRTWLWKRIAWRLQVDERGDLSPTARAVLLELSKQYPDPDSKANTRTTPMPGVRRPGTLTPGTVLTREYKGRTIRVTVLEKGVEHEGVNYSSLSAVAKAITGSVWNGKLFFGLTERKRGTKS